MNKLNIRKITDAALIVGIIGLMELVSIFLGGLYGSFLVYIIPIPIYIYSLMHGVKNSIITAFSALILSFIIVSPFKVLLLILPSLLVGILFNLLQKRNFHFVLSIILVSLIFLFFDILSTYVFGFLFDYNVYEDIKIMAEEIANILKNLNIDFIVLLLAAILPSILLFTAIMGSILFYLFSYIIAKRLKLKVETSNPFSIKMDLSFLSAIYLILFIFTLWAIKDIMTSNVVMYIIYCVIINIFVLLSFYYIYKGSLILSFISRAKSIRFLSFLSTLLIFICPILLIFIGLIDDIKKVLKNK